VVAERGVAGIAKVLDVTSGDGTHVVVEAVGHRPAYDMAGGVVRAGGTGEVEVSSVRRDGSLSRVRTIWITRLGDELYVRSVNGPDAAWYRSTRTARPGRIQARGVSRDITWIDVDAAGQPHVDPAVDAEYARKYQGSTAAVAHQQPARPHRDDASGASVTS
jgi:hypothetical protein